MTPGVLPSTMYHMMKLAIIAKTESTSVYLDDIDARGGYQCVPVPAVRPRNPKMPLPAVNVIPTRMTASVLPVTLIDRTRVRKVLFHRHSRRHLRIHNVPIETMISAQRRRCCKKKVWVSAKNATIAILHNSHISLYLTDKLHILGSKRGIYVGYLSTGPDFFRVGYSRHCSASYSKSKS